MGTERFLSFKVSNYSATDHTSDARQEAISKLLEKPIVPCWGSVNGHTRF